MYYSYLSPNFILYDAPDLINFFCKTGSNILSMVSLIFYNNNGRPYWIALSRINSSYLALLLGLIILRSFFCYFILIQLFAWIWGSIIKGHLLEFFKIIALSIEKSSLGSCYWLVHWPISKGLLRTPCKEQCPEDLMFKFVNNYFHYETVSYL